MSKSVTDSKAPPPLRHHRPIRSTGGLINMSVGFFGIQFGWGLQMANMSAIYEFLGANPDQIPLLWLAPPLTGLIVQPIIGHLSDRTWTWLGRRRPYFLLGAILSTLALFAMPQSKELWMAAALLWVLDASINISMEPFRAFIADLLPEEQRTRGFAMQSLFIGLGAVIASALPWIMANVFHVQNVAGDAIPATVRWSFELGASVFLAAVLWTILTTKEYPPEDLIAFRKKQRESAGVGNFVKGIINAYRTLPPVMARLAPVQLVTWFGLFCMWLYFPVAVARNVFGAPDTASPLYSQGVEFAGLCFGFYSAVTFLFALVLPRIAHRFGKSTTHTLCLLCGGAGLLSVALIHTPWMLFFSMTGVGIAWASVLAMPYAILASSLPDEQMGVYMGIFNLFIVLPEITVALTFGWVMSALLGNDRLLAVLAGGVLLCVAAMLMRRVPNDGVVLSSALRKARAVAASEPASD